MMERRSLLAKGWLILVLAAVSSLLWRLPGYEFDADLLALLPDYERSQWYTERVAADQHLAGISTQRFILAVGSENPAASLQAADSVRETLQAGQGWHYLEPAHQAEALWSDYWPHRYHLLSDLDRMQIASNPENILANARARLYAPLGDGRYDPINDPLYLFQNFLQAQSQASAVRVEQGYPSREWQGSHWRLLQFELEAGAFVHALSSELPERIEQLKRALPDDVQLVQSGMIFHAAHGARQARTEMSFIGIGSLLGVMVLLVAAFGRVSLHLLAALGAGLALALVVSVWSFDRLHLITLAFGASLIGVAIDYGIHARNAQLHGQTLSAMLHPLSLGLVTSVMAYGLQAAVAMPGLTQMALFSCVGLVASWISVVLWLPAAAEPRSPAFIIRRLFVLADGWAHRAGLLAVGKRMTFLLLVVAAVSLPWLPGRDQVASLQTSTPAMLAQEQTVMNLTEAPRPGRYLLATAPTLTALESRLQLLSDALTENGIAHQSINQWLPSVAQQQADHLLLSDFYQAHLPAWFAAMGADALSAQALKAFKSDPMQLGQLTGDLSAFYVHASPPYMAFIYPEQVLTQAQLAQLPAGDWHYVDRSAELTQLLAQYRHWLLLWLAAAIGFLSLLLWWRYGFAGPLLLAAPVVAGVIVLWCLVAMEGGVNLFHCLALLLVLGVGFDSGVFYAEAHSDAWRGATLSILTSLLAFGLLALCQTPVLQSFGRVAAFGLLLVWLLVPMMVQPLNKITVENN